MKYNLKAEKIKADPMSFPFFSKQEIPFLVKRGPRLHIYTFPRKMMPGHQDRQYIHKYFKCLTNKTNSTPSFLCKYHICYCLNSQCRPCVLFFQKVSFKLKAS